MHLGQLLTYASGLKAVVIVWISQRFTDEHRAALDWLNDITDERFNAFGLEIELWRIGDSEIAPKFNVVCEPNDWTRSVATVADQGKLTEVGELRLRFWGGFRDHVAENGNRISPVKGDSGNWVGFGIGRSGFKLQAVANFYDSVAQTYDGHELRAEMVVEHKEAKRYFAALEKDAGEIERDLGAKLSWYTPDNARNCKAYLRKPTDLRQEENWPADYAWLLTKLEALHKLFSSRIRSL